MRLHKPQLHRFPISHLIVSKILWTALTFSTLSIGAEWPERMELCRALIHHAAQQIPLFTMRTQFGEQMEESPLGDLTIHALLVNSYFVPVPGSGMITSVIENKPHDTPYLYPKPSNRPNIPNTQFLELNGTGWDGTIAKRFKRDDIDSLEANAFQNLKRKEHFFGDAQSAVNRQPHLPSYSVTADNIDWLVVPKYRGDGRHLGYEILCSNANLSFTLPLASLRKHIPHFTSGRGRVFTLDAKLLPNSHRLMILQRYRNEKGSSHHLIEYHLRRQEWIATHQLSGAFNRLSPFPKGIIASFEPTQAAGRTLDYFTQRDNSVVRLSYRWSRPIESFAMGVDNRMWVSGKNRVETLLPKGESGETFSMEIPEVQTITQLVPPSHESSHLLIKGIEPHFFEQSKRTSPLQYYNVQLALIDIREKKYKLHSLGLTTPDAPIPTTTITELGPEEWVVTQWRSTIRAFRTTPKDCDNLAPCEIDDFDDAAKPAPSTTRWPPASIGSWTSLHMLSVSPKGFRPLTDKLIELPFEVQVAGFSRNGRVFYAVGMNDEYGRPIPKFARTWVEEDDDDDDDDDEVDATPPQTPIREPEFTPAG